MPFQLDGKHLLLKSQIDPQQLLGLVNEKVSKQGRVLWQMSINGQAVQGEWLQALSNLSNRDVVSFTSLAASQVVTESTVNMIEVLPQLAADLQQIARYLQMGEDDKAFPLISTSVSGLESYLQLLTMISQYVSGQSLNAKEFIDPLVNWLQEFMTAWQREDLVLMADYLLYEIEPQLQHGYRWLHTLIAHEA